VKCGIGIGESNLDLGNVFVTKTHIRLMGHLLPGQKLLALQVQCGHGEGGQPVTVAAGLHPNPDGGATPLVVPKQVHVAENAAKRKALLLIGTVCYSIDLCAADLIFYLPLGIGNQIDA
jgi:hypothetical protein